MDGVVSSAFPSDHNLRLQRGLRVVKDRVMCVPRSSTLQSRRASGT